jgi:hypothetical protein
MSRGSDWLWREEIEKYLPHIGIMSFAGPASTIRWLFQRVKLKPQYVEEAGLLLTSLPRAAERPQDHWASWLWEIEGYVPQVRYMHLTTPQEVVGWLMETMVDVDEGDAKLAAKLKAIDPSGEATDEATRRKWLEEVFPGLRGEKDE